MQGLNLAGISQGLKAGSAVASGYAGFAAGNANAAYADANAHASEVDGASAMAASNAGYRAAIGNQLAAQGASGFAMGTGSALDALNASRINEATAAMQINRSAEMRATIYRAQASMDRKSAAQSLISGIVKGASSVIDEKVDYANANASAGFGGPKSKAGALTPASDPAFGAPPDIGTRISAMPLIAGAN